MGVILSWDGTTPAESFCPGIESLYGNNSDQGYNDSKGVLLSQDKTVITGIERLQGIHSVLE